MTLAQKAYINKLLKENKRMDGRALDQYREIKVETDISAKSAEGSARVTMGETVVIAGVKMEMGKPYPDRPEEGTIMVNAELLPMASPDFESGPPSIDSIELSRVVDRGIRESGYIDFKKLCVKAGEKIWLVFIDIYPINDAGNLFDAAALAAVAAIKNAKFPKYDEETETVDYKEKTENGLPLSDQTPIAITVLKIGEKLIIDPDYRENVVYDARLTTASLDNGHIAAMQKGGESTLTTEDIAKMSELSIKKAQELRGLLK